MMKFARAEVEGLTADSAEDLVEAAEVDNIRQQAKRQGAREYRKDLRQIPKKAAILGNLVRPGDEFRMIYHDQRLR